MKELVEKALQVAESQLGVLEERGNRGPRVEAYLRSTGIGPGNPWCAAFVYWCIDRAAGELEQPNPFLRTAYCPTIASWARQHDLLEAMPKAGDVFLHYASVAGTFRACHTGFVTRVSGAGFGTIEGNTNLDGSREGIGVFDRSRTNSDRYRFVRWDRLVQEPGDETYALFLNDQFLWNLPVRSGRSLCPVRKWGERLGFEVEWNPEKQVPLFDGHEVRTEIVLLDGTAYAPIRDLVESAGLTLRVDVPGHRVDVRRP